MAIKDGKRKRVTSKPLAKPISAPQQIPVKKPRVVEPVANNTVPAKQADIPTFAPTDKSIPAVKMTSVKPEAIKNKRLACLNTFNKLFTVRKASDKKDNPIQINITTNKR